MQIDWTTFALEIVNFLVLLWILKRFLFQPVRETLARRQTAIESRLAEGRATAEEAQLLKRQFEQRLAEWEKEKAAARAAFETELTAERERQMQALSRSLAEERARLVARDEHQQETLRQALETRAIDQARRFCSTLLARLAGPALEARLVELFLEDLSHLPEDQLAGLRAAAADSERSASIVSACPLDDSQRRRLSEAITRCLGRPIPLDYNIDTSLVAGLRVSLGPWQLQASLADELAFFAAATDRAA